jgi:hypothetical protein
MSGRDEQQIAPCRWCDETFTPAGIGTHQRYCDENPHPGISYEKQVEHDLLPPEDGDDTEDVPDLPPVQTLGPDAD